MENNIDDVKFIQRLTEKIISDFSGDPSRIYVLGMSNGGMLAYRLACEMPMIFAAVAVVSGAMVTNTCNVSQPVPLIHIHDINDTTVPYEGGTGMAGYVFPPTDSVFAAWATRNDCAVMDKKTVCYNDPSPSSQACSSLFRYASCSSAKIHTSQGTHECPAR